MQSISLQGIALEVPEVISAQQPDPFAAGAGWSVYDGRGNVYSSQRVTLFELPVALQLAIALVGDEHGPVRVRWEQEDVAGEA